MADILRSWQCMNVRCNRAFDAWEPNPECPACKCVRVNWIPGGGHLGGTAKAGDAELRALADIFKLNDMHSAEEGRGAKKVSLPPPAAPNSGPVHTFAGGFSAAINPAAGAQCVPTSNKIDYKIKATPGNSLPPSKIWGGGPTPVIEASHKGRA